MVEQVDREALEKIWYEGIRAMHPDAPPADEAIREILAAHRLAAEKAEREKLRRYLSHDDGCVTHPYKHECTCGLSDVLKESQMKVGDVVQLTHDDAVLKSLCVSGREPPPSSVGVIVSVYDGNLFEVRLFDRPERTFLLFDMELVPCG